MSRSTDAYATCNTKLNTHSTAHLARTWIFLLIRFFIYACSNGLFIYHCFSAFSAFWQANYLLNVDFLTTSSYCWLLLLLGARRIIVCIVSERPCTRYHFYLELGRVLQGLYCRAEWLELVNSKSTSWHHSFFLCIFWLCLKDFYLADGLVFGETPLDSAGRREGIFEHCCTLGSCVNLLKMRYVHYFSL